MFFCCWFWRKASKIFQAFLIIEQLVPKDKLVICIYIYIYTHFLFLYNFTILLPTFVVLLPRHFRSSDRISRVTLADPQMQRSKSESAICAPRLPGWRLPREGPEDGGGRMKVMDRTMEGMMG